MREAQKGSRLAHTAPNTFHAYRPEAATVPLGIRRRHAVESLGAVEFEPIDNLRSDFVAFMAGRAQTGGWNNLMPKLLLTNPKGKQRSIGLVSAANSQRPNEIQMRDFDQVNRRLPAHILEELSARKLTIPPREIGFLLSRLKAAADLNISIGD